MTTSTSRRKTLPDIWNLTEYGTLSNVLVVGCGGTGGHLIPNLARAISVANKDASTRGVIKLTIADGDVVESKNLVRQHFINRDLAKNKAEVLAQRYAAAFGMEIGAISKDIEDAFIISKLFGNNSRYYSNIVIGCVDNNASRKIINQWFVSTNGANKFWIDAGNEETAGQVICGFAPSSRSYNCVNAQSSYKNGIFSMPSVFDLYPDMIDESKFNSELSCAERAQSAPQNMLTNVTAATLIMNFVQKIIYGSNITNHGIEFSIDNVFNTKTNITENLSKVGQDRKRHWEV
jgi:PRTRC genetic system ThiF family protein